ncbi:hypothetical protein, partial [Streptomyces sp. CoH17]|uniref:hypothetical protein n=1 Tax=Streptomyces sp. CoH17 TaxID=2992806 RepID=UPI0022701A55
MPPNEKPSKTDNPAAYAAWLHERKSEAGKKGGVARWENRTRDDRSNQAKMARAAWLGKASPAERRDAAKKANTTKGPQKRKEIAKAANAAWLKKSTPAQRRDVALKGHETRRRRAAERAAAEAGRVGGGGQGAGYLPEIAAVTIYADYREVFPQWPEVPP